MLSLFQGYFSLQVKHRAIPAVAILIHLINSIQDGYNTLYSIFWAAAVAAGLDTFHLKCMALSFHFLAVQQLGFGGGG